MIVKKGQGILECTYKCQIIKAGNKTKVISESVEVAFMIISERFVKLTHWHKRLPLTLIEDSKIQPKIWIPLFCHRYHRVPNSLNWSYLGERDNDHTRCKQTQNRHQDDQISLQPKMYTK